MDAEWIISVFIVIDETMTALNDETHYHATLSDSETLTVAVVAAKYFNNNHKLTPKLLYQTHYLAIKGLWLFFLACYFWKRTRHDLLHGKNE